MSAADPLLDVSDLHAGYGSLQAVAGISLQVGAAETVALIGRNGAGKTTSLLAIAGLRYGRFPGRVKLGGTDVTRATACDGLSSSRAEPILICPASSE